MGDCKRDSKKNSKRCMELGLEAERQCKKGNYQKGVEYFLAAIEAGTEDLNTLSVIYCQLGNAYFYLRNYPKALHYHKCDLTLVNLIGDAAGEAKAVNNLGNTFKALGQFDKAIGWFEFHLEFYVQIGDKQGQERALYNLANIYHTKGKRRGKIEQEQDYSEEAKRDLLKAVECYKQTLRLVTESGDEAARGRMLGHIGNVYYILGDFQRAVDYQIECLKIVQSCNNKIALRRANTCLANSYIFINELEKAAELYKASLLLAEEEGTEKTVAKMCYLLANTHALMHDYPAAIETHLRYLKIVQQLEDKVGEGRAYWCLSNAYLAIANHKKALHFANLHLQISTDLGDVDGIQAAQTNIQTLDIDRSLIDEVDSKLENGGKKLMDLKIQDNEEDDSFEQLGRVPSSRLDQSYDFCETDAGRPSNDRDLFDLIEKLQSQRMDEQRVTMPFLPGFK